MALFLLLLLAPCAHATRAQEEIVVLTDGTRLRGKVGKAGDAIIVHTGERDVTLSPTLVASRTKATTAAEAPVEYLFHQEEMKTAKRGTLALVVSEFKWNSAFSPAGVSSVSCRDPKLGSITFAVVVHRITPEKVFVAGVEYRWSTAFATRTMAPLLDSMVAAQIDPGNADQLRKASRWYRTYGDFDAAARWLDRLAEVVPADPALARERETVEVERFRAAVEEFDRRLAAGAEEQALARGRDAQATPAVEQELADAAKSFRERLEALGRRREAVAEIGKRLAALDPAAPPPTGAQAERAQAILAKLEGSLDEARMPALCAEWAEALARDPSPRLSAAAVHEAAGLADAVADFFRQEKPEQARELARKLEASTIPQPWKVAILRSATRYDEPEPRSGWQRVEFEHPTLRKKFHYFVQIPRGYRPDVPCPALMTLHGQNATAEATQGWWGELAERYGFVLISPEYIYGRKFGYMGTETEFSSVMGALRHASGRFNLDLDRVFLQGSSQGGHAAWDIGSAHSDRFAGVIPIIGAALTTRKLANLLHTGLYCVDGSEDGGSPVLDRKAIQALAKLRADARYVEYVARGHESFNEEYETLFRWMSGRRTAEAPLQAHLIPHLKGNARRRFVEIAGFARPPAASSLEQADIAEISARIDRAANAIDAESRGATLLRFRLSPLALELAKPVRITVNGKVVHDAVVPPSWEKALLDAHATRDRRDAFLAEVTVPAK